MVAKCVKGLVIFLLLVLNGSLYYVAYQEQGIHFEISFYVLPLIVTATTILVFVLLLAIERIKRWLNISIN